MIFILEQTNINSIANHRVLHPINVITFMLSSSWTFLTMSMHCLLVICIGTDRIVFFIVDRENAREALVYEV